MESMPMWARSSCWAASPPPPALSPPSGYEKHVCLTCFSCLAAPLPLPLSPCFPTLPCTLTTPRTRKTCASHMCFSCPVALLPQPSSPASPPLPAPPTMPRTRKTRACCVFFVFGGSHTPALVPNTKIVPTRAQFSC